VRDFKSVDELKERTRKLVRATSRTVPKIEWG
jgi:hypothetical protein